MKNKIIKNEIKIYAPPREKRKIAMILAFLMVSPIFLAVQCHSAHCGTDCINHLVLSKIGIARLENPNPNDVKPYNTYCNPSGMNICPPIGWGTIDPWLSNENVGEITSQTDCCPKKRVYWITNSVIQPAKGNCYIEITGNTAGITTYTITIWSSCNYCDNNRRRVWQKFITVAKNGHPLNSSYFIPFIYDQWLNCN